MAATILGQGELITIAPRQKIHESERLIAAVYFPLDSVLGVATQMQGGQQIDVGTIGREGVSAISLLMGASRAANDCYCKVAGTAIRIDVTLFRRLTVANAAFRALLDRYLQAYVTMLAQFAACNALHSAYQRCARWLLMTHDRVNRDAYPLTHRALAMMLGTSRSAASKAAKALQQDGSIRFSHGTMTILDRSGLENATCDCYEIVSDRFSRLLRCVAKADAPGAPRLRRGRDSGNFE